MNQTLLYEVLVGLKLGKSYLLFRWQGCFPFKSQCFHGHWRNCKGRFDISSGKFEKTLCSVCIIEFQFFANGQFLQYLWTKKLSNSCFQWHTYLFFTNCQILHCLWAKKSCQIIVCYDVFCDQDWSKIITIKEEHRLSTKNQDYQLGWDILAECRQINPNETFILCIENSPNLTC